MNYKAPVGKWVRFSSSFLTGGMWENFHMELMIGNRVYPYEDVPRVVWERLYAAPSKGRFYNAEIKGQYV